MRNKHLIRTNLDELIKRNIRDLENDSELLKKIEERIEIKHTEKLFKEIGMDKSDDQ